MIYIFVVCCDLRGLLKTLFSRCCSDTIVISLPWQRNVHCASLWGAADTRLRGQSLSSFRLPPPQKISLQTLDATTRRLTLANRLCYALSSCWLALLPLSLSPIILISLRPPFSCSRPHRTPTMLAGRPKMVRRLNKPFPAIRFCGYPAVLPQPRSFLWPCAR